MERAEYGIIFDTANSADEEIIWLVQTFLSHADGSFAREVASAKIKLSRESPRIQISLDEARAAVSGLTNFNDKLASGHTSFKRDLDNATQAIQEHL